MLQPSDNEIFAALLIGSPTLAIAKANGIYRLVLIERLHVDHESLDIYGDGWELPFERFVDNVRLFNFEDGESFISTYPASQNQPMLEFAFSIGIPIELVAMSNLVRMLQPVQRGRITKE